MVKPNAASGTGDSLWTCGLSLADIEIPSEPTEIAQAAHVVATVTLDLSDASDETHTGGAVGVELSAEECDLNDMTRMWASTAPDEDQDFADRKVLWPFLDADIYRRDTSLQKRIEDIIAAVRLMKCLQQQKRTPFPDEDAAASLLRTERRGPSVRTRWQPPSLCIRCASSCAR